MSHENGMTRREQVRLRRSCLAVPGSAERMLPTQEQFDQARAMLASYEGAITNERTGAAVFEGEMIDEASRKMAELTVGRGRAAGLLDPIA
jgi:citrate lyase subunit beta/citryl-CoA lyase